VEGLEGKGPRHVNRYFSLQPDVVWPHGGLSLEVAQTPAHASTQVHPIEPRYRLTDDRLKALERAQPSWLLRP